MESYDVENVGAGPAGSASALLLARAGLDVLLLDAREFPRAKACGDCISPGANRLLRELGVWDHLIAQRPAQLRGWRLVCGSRSFSAGFGEDVSLGIAREQLDAVLLEHARAAGAAVRTGVRVQQLLRAGGAIAGVAAGAVQYRARLTIGADGLRSRVARLLNAHARTPRLRKFSLSAHLRAAHHGATIGEMHVYPGACLGIAPVQGAADPLCNVTVVLRAGTQHDTGRHQLMRAALRRMQRPDIAALIGADTPVLASGPFDWPVRRIAFEGAALVGDAAGYFDPFTGQGIYQALAGADLLARSVMRAFRRGSRNAFHMTDYASAHADLMGSTRRVQHIVDYICARPRLARSAFAALARTPELAERLVGVTGDLRPARDLLSPTLLTKFVAASFSHAVT